MMDTGRILIMVFACIWNMSIMAGYCILAVLMIRLLLHRIPRKYLYAMWLVVAFRLLCPVSVNTEFSLFNLGTLPGRTEDLVKYPAIVFHEPEDLQASAEQANAEEGRGDEQTGVPVVERALSSHQDWLSELSYGHDDLSGGKFLKKGACVWTGGMLIILIYLAVSAGGLKRKVRMAVRLRADSEAYKVIWNRKHRSLHGRERSKKTIIYECDDIPSPFVKGIFRPKIYLPCGMEKEQQKIVLLHEQYHIYRKDHLVKSLSFLLLMIYWFQPLVWAAWLCMCRDMEMSCDEKVLEMLGEDKRKEYSRTLLVFASEKQVFRHMPLAFGEQDAKKRIQHVLDYRKPAVWGSILAVAAILGVLLLLGTDSKKTADKKPENPAAEWENETQEIAVRLYEARNPYVGDASANGRLLGVICERLPNTLAAETSFKMELQTGEEPYGFHFRLEKEPPNPGLEKELEDMDMAEVAVLMLALTDNLGIVKWSYVGSEGEGFSDGGSLNAQEAAAWCGSEDIKEFSASEEKVQLLLDRMESLNIRPWDSNIPFISWYGELPGELYEHAIPIEDAIYEERGKGETCMFLLAQTEDRTVTVYGCSSYKYGDRGITVSYRTPDGERHDTYLDECYWGGKLTESGTEIYMTDYDQDGSDEIVLRRLTGLGRDSRREQLTVFEICEDGTLESAGIFSELDGF